MASLRDPLSKRSWLVALAIGLVYALGGVAWILGSDALVNSLSSDPAWVQAAQRYKGLFYVAFTAVALVLLVRLGHLALARSGEVLRTRDAQAREALLHQQMQYAQLHQSLAEVLWLATPEADRVLYVSPAFETLYGRPRAEFESDIGVWLEAVHPDDRDLALQSHRQLLEQGRSECSYRILRPDGGLRWVCDRKRKILGDDGRTLMIGGIAEDVTAARERDAEREASHAELEHRVQERTAELERVNAELEAFTRTAAHDLRSPLNALAGLSYLLLQRHGAALGDNGSTMLQQIDSSARHMSALITDLLTLSRVSATELSLQTVDLAALARELMWDLRQQAPQRRLRFEAPEQLLAAGDAGLLRALLTNLLGNAWKFTGRRDEAWIRFGGQVADGRLEVVVQDNGAGFDAAHAEHLFEPFRRFHAASEFAGTGVGLATCRRIVERHGGRLGAESEPGCGASFRFTLPLPAADQPLT